jgi:hypothetical protein
MYYLHQIIAVISFSYLLATQVNTYHTPPNHTDLLGHQYDQPTICPSPCSNEKNVGIAFPLDLFTQATCNAQMKIIAVTQI